MATAIPIVPANYQSYTQLFPISGSGGIAAALTMSFINNGISAFFVQNLNAATTTVTVTSVPDAAGRGANSCDNLAVTVAAGDTTPQIVQFGPFTPVWWNQPNGVILVAFSAIADVTVLGVQYA
jgi:hypothetical protein